MQLTDAAVRQAKPKDKSYKMADSQGLYIQVMPSGSKHWKMKYRFAGREKKLSFGEYPRISLRDARNLRDEARNQITKGIDPSLEKRRNRLRGHVAAGNSFSDISREYCDKRRRDGDKAWAPSTAKRCEYLLSLLDSSIGKMPIDEIEPIDALAAVRKIEAKGKLESSRRTMQLAGAVFRYAVASARLKSDPTRDLRGALINPTVTHYGAITDASQVGPLLRAIDAYKSQGMTDWALKLAPHVFVRPGELRSAQWEEFDLEARVWTIPADKTKMRKPHHVPLSRQSVELVEQIRSITAPWSYIFPSLWSRKRPMSDNTLNAALRRMGYASSEMTAHGFRAMASTLLNESGKWSYDAIERALAHGDNNRVRAAYHRGAHWEERVAMAQWWSDYLDERRADVGQKGDEGSAPSAAPEITSSGSGSVVINHDLGWRRSRGRR